MVILDVTASFWLILFTQNFNEILRSLISISFLTPRHFYRPAPRPQVNNNKCGADIVLPKEPQKRTNSCCGDQRRMVWILLLLIVFLSLAFTASLIYIAKRVSTIETAVKNVEVALPSHKAGKQSYQLSLLCKYSAVWNESV